MYWRPWKGGGWGGLHQETSREPTSNQQIGGHIYALELEALEHLHFSTIDADSGMYTTLVFAVKNQLIRLAVN